jgi:transcription initiation factor TFIIB|tara:strand:+ start:1214 stop:2125 length:912 start_codon:yes stop_codon:yes gene_type:complete
MNFNEKCSECGSRNHYEDDKGEISCVECGLVLTGVVIDSGPEWRNYGEGEANSQERTGMPNTELLHDKGLTTDIDWRNRDFAGASLNSNSAKIFRRLRRQHQRTRISNSKERNLSVALAELQRIASQMGLPRPVREQSAFIYRKAVEKGLVRGRSIEGVVAASIYAACRMGNIPRTLDEVGAFSRTGRKEIGRTYREVAKALSLRVAPSSPSEYIPRFCSILNLPNLTETRAMKILSDAEKIELTAGRGPTGIAARSVYLASLITQNARTQKEVSEAAGITEVTIRNRYKELCVALSINPDDY